MSFLWTAFVFGLLGSLHCVGMCGPIAFILPLDRTNSVRRIWQIINYHLGRIFTYGVIGISFGLIGESLNLLGYQRQISIGIGIIMILAIITPQLAKRFTKPLNHYIMKRLTWVKSKMQIQLNKKSTFTLFTLGFLNGLLPCGLVYMAVFGSLAIGNTLEGGFYMMLFGLGTVPLMTGAIYLGNFMKLKLRQRVLKIIPVAVVIIGLLFILRGLGLGIPYVSPSNSINQQHTSTSLGEVKSCH